MHLHIGPVQSAHGDGAVHHKLHIARSAGLLAGGGDLLRHLAGGHQSLGHGHPIILQKHHLKPVLAERIVIDLIGQGADEPDDPLSYGVARGGLGPEEEGLGAEVHVGAILQALVEVEDVHDIQKLALILVQALDLDIEHGIGV